MSRRALLLAVRDQLRALPPVGLGYLPRECEVMYDGRPPPRAGAWFAAVHRGRRSGQLHSECLDYELEFFVTVTARVNVPVDRLGAALYEASEKLDDRVDAIVALVQRQGVAILTAANTLLGSSFDQAGQPRGFVERPYYLDDDNGRLVGDEHWWGLATEVPTGIAHTIRFGGARRVQALSSPNPT